MTFKALPRDEQISDDFTIFYDDTDGFYFAVRAPSEGNDFIFRNKSKWIAISDAVSEFQRLTYPDLPVDYSIKGKWDHELQKVVWQSAQQ